MKRLLSLFIIISALVPLYGCRTEEHAEIVATTLPVYEFTAALCENTGLKVKQLVTEEVSCLHDYTLKVDQTKSLECAQTIVISGAGLEAFLPDLDNNKTIDASAGITLHCSDSDHAHTRKTHETGEYQHTEDPHIWLSVPNAKVMCANIFEGLTKKYPEYSDIMSSNYSTLQAKLTDLENYAKEQLKHISHKELITFHDGFHYLAESLDLTIVRAIEEESGSEASAHELKELITIVRKHKLPAVFTERSGSTSAADIIARETDVKIYTLDMAMSGDSYFDAMYHNIDMLKEALE